MANAIIDITDELDEHGGTIRSITGVSLSNDTVTPETMLRGTIAHDANGNLIIGSYSPLPVVPIAVPMKVSVLNEVVPIKVAVLNEYYKFKTDRVIKVDCPPYEGEYEVTPSQEVQYLDTVGKRMLNNVKINPIPNNYGLITWNGQYLTVS